MLFNSIEFFVFFPIVFIGYWVLFKSKLTLQNTFITLASYFFYGWWNWKFLILIIISTLIDFFVAKAIGKNNKDKQRKLFLTISLISNLGMLGFFKYYDFFLDNFVEAFSFFGMQLDPARLSIILPVGISFYTFQTLSYTIDVYRKKMQPTNDFMAFSAFVCFFPQLVAGPIERATNLLPQFHKARNFNYPLAILGLRQILWGLFKKVVIADNAAVLANHVFNNSAEFDGGTLFFGVFFFAIQIYGDFSGYSDIAIGLSRLFGFDLMRNFANPYFSRSIPEFWRRWHISLSTWFRDYLYIPLGGSRGTKFKAIRNTFIIFVVSGFWHGANWTFIAWGFVNALLFLPSMLSNANRKNLDVVAEYRSLPTIKEFMQMLGTFSLICVTWVFFRAENINHALIYIKDMLSFSLPKGSDFIGAGIHPLMAMNLIGVMLVIEWFGRREQFAIQALFRDNKTLRYAFYYATIIAIFWFGGQQQDFIYFQF